jgi:tetratricopeptide (TPR) repeat protein/Zn-dependent protease
MSQSLVLLLAVPLLLQVVTFYLIVQRLLQVRFRYPSYQSQSPQTLPPDWKTLFDPTIQTLQQLGFKVCGICRLQKLIHLDTADDRVVILHNATTGSFAEVEIRFPVDAADPTIVTFHQVFQDGTWLTTMNALAHCVVGQIPDTHLADAFAPTLLGQWTHHQQQLKTIDKPTQSQTAVEFVIALQAHQQRYVDVLLTSRALKMTRQGWFLRFPAAIQTAWKLRRGMARQNQRLKARKQWLAKNPQPAIAVPTSLQIRSFHRMRELETSKRELGLGKWVLLVTLALFVLAMVAMPEMFAILNWQDLLIFLGVLVLHELGHFTAMKLFGYKDTKMFFLPMFGAAVTGKKVDASLSEKVWVLLAGPLPGLILGFSLMAAMQLNPALRWLDRTAWLLVGLNLPNLLPLYPLDGGKIAHHLLFSRYPLSDVIFKSCTVALFALTGFLSPMLWVMAIVTALSIPTSYRTAQLNQSIQRQIRGQIQGQSAQSPWEADRILHFAFEQLDHKLPWSKRDTIVKDLLERQRENHAPLVARWGLAMTYGLSLLLSMGGVIAAVLPRLPDRENLAQHPVQVPKPTPEQQLRQDLTAANQAIVLQPRSAPAYIKRASIHQALYAQAAQGRPNTNTLLQNALTDYNTAIKLDPKPTAWYQTRARIKLDLNQPSAAIADYNLLIKRSPKTAVLYFDRAELHYQTKNPKAALQDLQTALKLNPNNPYAYELRSTIYQSLGNKKQAQQDQQKAQKLFQQASRSTARR